MAISHHNPVMRRFSGRFQTDMLIEGLLVGFAAGAVVTLYRLALHHAERLLRAFLDLLPGAPLLVAVFFALLFVLCVIVSRLVSWEPFTQGSGIPQVDAEVMGQIDMPWCRVLAAKFAEGTLCALAGLSLGREGPSVQLGAMAGKGVSKGLGRGRGEERLLVTCGAAAGMSAAFNAPLTGVLFALEEIHKEFSGPLIVSVMAASASSAFLVEEVMGVRPVLHLAFDQRLPLNSYPLVILLALVCGIVGALHNQGMFALSERVFGKITTAAPFSRYLIAFTLMGVVALVAPTLLCGGDAIVDLLSDPKSLSVGVIFMLLIGKYVLTSVCFGSGAPGGTLFPLCVLGMLCGALFGVCGADLGLVSRDYVANFIVLGIGGLFASVVRAPVTGVVLAFELTGSLDALLSVSIVSIVAYIITNLLKVDPFYEHLVFLLLGSSESEDAEGQTPFGEKVLRDCVVGAGSELEGCLVSEVTWPEGVRIVTVARAGNELVPTGSTRLAALDELLLIMDASTADAIENEVWRLSRSSLATKSTPRGRAHFR